MHNIEIEKSYPLAGYLNVKDKFIELVPGLDGLGRSGWILKLVDGSLIVVSFEWGVRPGIKAVAGQAVHIKNGKSEIIPVALEHSGSAKDGKLYPLLTGKIINTNVKIDPKSTWTYVYSPELKDLLAQHSLSIGTPNSVGKERAN